MMKKINTQNLDIYIIKLILLTIFFYMQPVMITAEYFLKFNLKLLMKILIQTIMIFIQSQTKFNTLSMIRFTK
jgi:hypothetical protein